MVLRPIGDEYVLIDNAYVDGMMDGEASEGLGNGRYREEDFNIR